MCIKKFLILRTFSACKGKIEPKNQKLFVAFIIPDAKFVEITIGVPFGAVVNFLAFAI